MPLTQFAFPGHGAHNVIPIFWTRPHSGPSRPQNWPSDLVPELVPKPNQSGRRFSKSRLLHWGPPPTPEFSSFGPDSHRPSSARPQLRLTPHIHPPNSGQDQGRSNSKPCKTQYLLIMGPPGEGHSSSNTRKTQSICYLSDPRVRVTVAPIRVKHNLFVT